VAVASVEVGVEKKYGPYAVFLGLVPYRFAETEEMKRREEKGIELVLGNDYMEEAGLYFSKREELIDRGGSLLISLV